MSTELLLYCRLELAVIDGWCLNAREQIRDYSVKQREIDRCQLGDVHVLHTEQKQLLILQKCQGHAEKTQLLRK